jgi:hypothetical protein
MSTPTPNPANNLVTITLPTTRVDGSALALSEIGSLTISKAVDAGAASNVMTLAGPFTSPTVQYMDDSPDSGSTDKYLVTVTDVEGNVSDSGTVSVEVAAAAEPIVAAVPGAPTLTAPVSVLAAPSAPTLTAAFNAPD